MNWFILALKNTFNFKGRSRRKELGWYFLIGLIIAFAVAFITTAALLLNFTGFVTLIVTVDNVISALLTITAISLTTRRLHDLGYSGWWQLLIYIPLAYMYGRTYQLTGAISEQAVSQAIINDISLQIVSLIFMLISVILFLVLFFKDGQKHANKYGESPKYPNEPERENQTMDLTALTRD